MSQEILLPWHYILSPILLQKFRLFFLQYPVLINTYQKSHQFLLSHLIPNAIENDCHEQEQVFFFAIQLARVFLYYSQPHDKPELIIEGKTICRSVKKCFVRSFFYIFS